jgi:hypothetical protein
LFTPKVLRAGDKSRLDLPDAEGQRQRQFTAAGTGSGAAISGRDRVSGSNQRPELLERSVAGASACALDKTFAPLRIRVLAFMGGRADPASKIQHPVPESMSFDSRIFIKRRQRRAGGSMNKKRLEWGHYFGMFLTFGAGIGAGFGAALGNVAIGAGVGAGLGILLSFIVARTTTPDESP